MTSIDVRTEKILVVDKIIFADNYAQQLHNRGDGIYMQDSYEAMQIKDEEHARNLIKALEKAIELGWFK